MFLLWNVGVITVFLQGILYRCRHINGLENNIILDIARPLLYKDIIKNKSETCVIHMMNSLFVENVFTKSTLNSVETHGRNTCFSKVSNTLIKFY